ncbi:MAG: type I-E CRISPR-associated protein Cse1/CasA [Acidobacteriota bacterium]
MTYNLLVEPWIPVLWTDGRFSRIGIREALQKAGRIRQIADSSPMDCIALLRLLIAVLQWCKPTLSDEERALPQEERGIPLSWLAHRLGPPEQPNDAFCLLGEGRRFYQDSALSEAKTNRTVSDLFAYFPAATEINHFRHVFDKTVALCAACCAIGLVRLSACATQGGQGLSPSINNAPPIYFVPTGRTLLETLLLNWPIKTNGGGDAPAWEVGRYPGQEIGVLDGLTWQPRSAWLGPLVADPDRRCPRCDSLGPFISKMVFRKGRSRKAVGGRWRDPHVAWTQHASDENEDDVETKDHALRRPNAVKYPASNSALWRLTARAILESACDKSIIPSVCSAAVGGTKGPSAVIACFEPSTKQAKSFDEQGVLWRSLLVLPEPGRRQALEEIAWLDRLRWDRCLSSLSSRKNALVSLTWARFVYAADIESRLRDSFVVLVDALSAASNQGAAQAAVENWREAVQMVYAGALTRISAALATGTRLARISASRQAASTLQRVCEAASRAATKLPRSKRKGGET